MLRLPLLLFCLFFPLFQTEAVDFSKEVLPILKRSCLECHGAEEAKGGLRLHSAEGAAHADMAELLRRVRLPRADKEAMPKRGEPLSPAEVGVLAAWVVDGARWPEKMVAERHWSLVPPQRADVPGGLSEHPVDAFLLQKLRQSLRCFCVGWHWI
jgi:hypothetical protein